MIKTITNTTQRPTLGWSKMLRIGISESEYEVNLQQAWAELEERPSTVRHGFSVPAAPFWELLNARFAFKREDVRLSTDHMLTPTEEQITSRFYFIRLTPTAYVSFTDYTPEFNDDTTEHADIVPRRVGDVNFYYKNDEQTERHIQDACALLLALKLPALAGHRYHVLTAGISGYAMRRSVPTKVDVDLELTYGKGFTDSHDGLLHELCAKGTGVVVISGPSGTGKSVYLRRLQADAAQEKTVLHVPQYLLGEMGKLPFVKFLLEQKDLVLVLEDVDDELESPFFVNALATVLHYATDLKVLLLVEDAAAIPAAITAEHLLRSVALANMPAKRATALSAKLGANHKYVKAVPLEQVYSDAEEPEKSAGFGYDTRRGE